MSTNQTQMVWLAVMAAVLLTFSVVFASGELLPRNLVSSGGGSVAQNGIVLRGAIGQPAMGAVQNGQILCSGFLCAPGAPPVSGAQHPLYLPLVVR